MSHFESLKVYKELSSRLIVDDGFLGKATVLIDRGR